MIKKVLIAVAAIAMPLGTATAASVASSVASSGVAGAASSTVTTCAQTGTVTFQAPGLSTGGALTASTAIHTKASVTPTGTGCSGNPISVVITDATTACPQTGGVPNSGDPASCDQQKKGVYEIDSGKPNYYDTDSQFESNGLSDLATALMAKPIKTTIDNLGLSLVVPSSSDVTEVVGGACGGSNVGFEATGNAMYKTATAGTFTNLFCVSGDSGTNTTGNFLNDLTTSDSSIVIQKADIGGSSALTVTMGNVGCPTSGTVTFPAPGLSHGGSLTANTSETTKSSQVGNGTGGCGTAPSNENIASATTACPETGGVPNSGDPDACFQQKKGVYLIDSGKPNYYDTSGSFISSGTSDLQAALEAKPPKVTANGIGVTLVYGSASQVAGSPCASGQVGFNLSGNAEVSGAVVGTYTDLVCITGDSGPDTTGNFLSDLTSSNDSLFIQTATVGGNSALSITWNQ